MLVFNIEAAELSGHWVQSLWLQSMVESGIECEIIADIQMEAPISQKIYNQRNSTRYNVLQFSIFLFYYRCYVVSAAEGIEPGLVCLRRVGYHCSLYCCLHVTFHLTIPASLLLPLPFVICINANLLPFCSAFCQLTACLFLIYTHSFSDCSLGNCHFLLSFPTWNNFSVGYFSCNWLEKLFRYV